MNFLSKHVIVITNISSKSESPWKMPFWIFTAAWVWIFCTFSDILLSRIVGSYKSFVVNLWHGYIFPLCFSLFEDILINIYIKSIICSSCSLATFFFVPLKIVHSIQARNRFLFLSMQSGLSTSQKNTLSVYSCLGWFPFHRSFWIRVVFSFHHLFEHTYFF